MELSFLCQQNLENKLMCHPVLEIFRPNEKLLVGVERRTGLAG